MGAVKSIMSPMIPVGHVVDWAARGIAHQLGIGPEKYPDLFGSAADAANAKTEAALTPQNEGEKAGYYGVQIASGFSGAMALAKLGKSLIASSLSGPGKAILSKAVRTGLKAAPGGGIIDALLNTAPEAAETRAAPIPAVAPQVRFAPPEAAPAPTAPIPSVRPQARFGGAPAIASAAGPAAEDTTLLDQIAQGMGGKTFAHLDANAQAAIRKMAASVEGAAPAPMTAPAENIPATSTVAKISKDRMVRAVDMARLLNESGISHADAIRMNPEQRALLGHAVDIDRAVKAGLPEPTKTPYSPSDPTWDMALKQLKLAESMGK
jgi:hypothetical protein